MFLLDPFKGWEVVAYDPGGGSYRAHYRWCWTQRGAINVAADANVEAKLQGAVLRYTVRARLA